MVDHNMFVVVHVCCIHVCLFVLHVSPNCSLILLKSDPPTIPIVAFSLNFFNVSFNSGLIGCMFEEEQKQMINSKWWKTEKKESYVWKRNMNELKMKSESQIKITVFKKKKKIRAFSYSYQII